MKPRAPRNRTLSLSETEVSELRSQLIQPAMQHTVADLENQILHQDLTEAMPSLPKGWVDLLFLDPPYNLTKSFNGRQFRSRSQADYLAWLQTWLPLLLPTLKPTASIYVCGDWRSSGALQQILSEHLKIRNRITWEREKGRGAKRNWKNCSEDVWFCTVSNHYTFNGEEVRLRRRVRAPYRTAGKKRKPKGWTRTLQGKFRFTHASNLWTDLTVPFWSMPENTDHPTQKPEKLLAKVILASSNPGEMVLDPFLGSGTAAVVAKKLGRRFVGIERDLLYCCLALKRLQLAETNDAIQGYMDGTFWERNAL